MSDVFYAHCQAISVEAVEVYKYHSEMDGNPSIKSIDALANVDVFIPLDRFHPYIRKIDQGNKKARAGNQVFNIGRLYITHQNETTIQDKSISTSVSKIDLNIPLPPPIKHHRNNRYVYGVHTYGINFPDTAPWQWPFEVSVNVFDEFMMNNTLHELSNSDLIDKINSQNTSFERKLVLEFQIKLAIPKARYHKPPPFLKVVQIDWPVTTSYHSLSLENKGQPHKLTYNAKKNCVEWSGIPFNRVPAKDVSETEQNLIIFNITNLLLSLDEPGDFYNKKSPLPCRIEIEIPNCLLSGEQVDYFNAKGQLVESRERGNISRKSIIKIEMNIDLEQRFSRRTLSPLYEFFFEGLILRREQLQVIGNILKDLGFHNEEEIPFTIIENENQSKYALRFKKFHGHSQMRLWVRAIGNRRITNRETIVPGGRKYSTPVESGNTEIALRAEMIGEVNELTAIMNKIHRALEEHFRYMTPPD